MTILDQLANHARERVAEAKKKISPFDNVEHAVKLLHPFAVDVSSGIETNGHKDKRKMAAFAAAVRKEDRI